MRICILGAGVVGVTTAWLLSEDGHDVTIIDRQSEPGRETSFGNGAQLSYAYVAPLASFGTLKKMPAMLLAKDSPIRIKPSLDPDFIRWGLSFLAACNDRTERETTKAQLALAVISRAETMRLTESLSLDYGLEENGKLVVFRKQDTFAGAARSAQAMQAMGITQEVLSGPECVAREPTLRIPAKELAGGIYTPSEQVGDCARFSSGLGVRLRARNSVRYLMDTAILEGIVRQGRLVAVRTSQGEIEADLFVLALGPEAPAFTRQLGFHLPIYPMKGYSLTTRLTSGGMLRHSVTDFDAKTVFAPLHSPDGTRVRVAGIADLVGHDRSLDQKRLAAMTRTARAAFDIDLDGDTQPWAGLRPMTPDSRPIVGPSPLDGLFLNTGHGALGWTLAAGSARLAADLIGRRTPAIDPNWFSLRRQR
jgi:D-amino-acid dehydrogenase